MRVRAADKIDDTSTRALQYYLLLQWLAAYDYHRSPPPPSVLRGLVLAPQPAAASRRMGGW